MVSARGWIAEVRKLNVVAQKRPGRSKKMLYEVLGMASADPQICSEWRGRLRGRLVPCKRNTGLKMDMIMMMIFKSGF